MNEASRRIAARPTRQAGRAPAIAPHVEELARRNLRRNRALATGLLLAMVATFAATHFVRDPGFAVLLLRAGAEAGIIGGLADWFAVTALFRHPLGLPIPHTAILAANKERIGRTLGNFIEKNFLTPAVVLPKLRGARAGERFAAWLAEQEPVYGYAFDGLWMDIGDREQLLEADNLLRDRRGLPQRAEYAVEI